MKVALIDVNCKYSSTGKIVYDLYTQSSKDGIEAVICYGRGKKIEEHNIYKFGIEWETKLHALLTRLTGWTGCFSFFSTRKLISFLEVFKPDIIHLHEPHGYFLSIKNLFSFIQKTGIPLIYTFHCDFAYTGKCGVANNCMRWINGCGNCPRIRAYPKSLFFDHTASMWKKKFLMYQSIKKMVIVTPSEWLANRVKLSFLADKEIHVIHNGINSKEIFYPRETHELRQRLAIENNKVVLSVAPDIMSKQKGGHWVLKLAEEMKEDAVVFILIGVSDFTTAFPENVIALERTEDQEELAFYYSLADCFVICSEQETFPTTCLEAISCGTPVVGFDVGGVKEAATHPVGCVCSYGDISKMAYLVREYIHNRPSSDSFDNLRKYFSSQRMYKEYADLYCKVVNMAETKIS